MCDDAEHYTGLPCKVELIPDGEEIWIDEPLPCIPLEVCPISVMVTIGGEGKPRFRVETLVDPREWHVPT